MLEGSVRKKSYAFHTLHVLLLPICNGLTLYSINPCTAGVALNPWPPPPLLYLVSGVASLPPVTQLHQPGNDHHQGQVQGQEGRAAPHAAV